MNKEGYRDPTADRAVSNASRMPKHIREIFLALDTVVGIQGLKVTEIMDRQTGKKYRR